MNMHEWKEPYSHRMAQWRTPESSGTGAVCVPLDRSRMPTYSRAAEWNASKIIVDVCVDLCPFCWNVHLIWQYFVDRRKVNAWAWLLMMYFRLRSCLFCEGRISVLKRWFKTPIQNAVHGSTVYASLEKKTISWACTAHCSRLLFELKWNGKAFIWRHLNVVICDFAFMLPPESAFCSNHDRKRTFLGCVHAYFARAESAFWNADSKRRSKTPFTGVLFMLPSRRRRFREHALRIVRGYCSSSSEPERRLYDVI